MEPRISLVTLGVDDLERATRFYEAMGLERNQRFAEDVSFFQMGGSILALWGRHDLARDAGVEISREGYAPVALAYNTRSEEEVAEVLDMAARAGGRIVKPAHKAFWGGMQGYFADTEGNLWEVAHNPDFPIDAEGRISLPE
jgi:predicted lactoylglutathione lyase